MQKPISKSIFMVSAFSVAMLNAQQHGARSLALQSLRSARPNVEWDSKKIVIADVTCDGIPDALVLGQGKGGVWIGVVSGTRQGGAGKTITMRFSVGEGSQDSFCAPAVRIELNQMDCTGDEDERLEGCRVTKGCNEFSVADDKCDSFHFYWDSSKKAIRWWRR